MNWETSGSHPIIAAALRLVCSLNISRPYTDVADWSVNDPKETLDVQCNRLSGCRTASVHPW
jgi:hypothetical protein